MLDLPLSARQYVSGFTDAPGPLPYGTPVDNASAINIVRLSDSPAPSISTGLLVRAVDVFAAALRVRAELESLPPIHQREIGLAWLRDSAG